jgi:hypothetical protein
MKYIKPYNEELSYSGGDVTKMPIIGTITTKPLTYTFGNEEHIIPSETYSIVEVITDNDKEIYVTNQWYKEYKRIPLLIHGDLVETKSF